MKFYIILLTIFLTSCSQSVDTSAQISVAKNFYNSLIANDIKSARKYIADKEHLLDDGETTFNIKKYKFSEISIINNKSYITTSIPNKNGVMNFSTVLTNINGKWEVVVRETMINMIKNAVENGDVSGSVKIDLKFENN